MSTNKWFHKWTFVRKYISNVNNCVEMGHCPLQTGKKKADTYILILARQERYKTLVAKCGIGNAVQRNWKKKKKNRWHELYGER